MVSPQVAGLIPVIGREADLASLRTKLGSGAVRVLAGMGGVGKTSLARAYAQRHRGDYGVVWWIRAEDSSAIDAEFRALLEILLPPGEAAMVGNARTAAFAQLNRQPDPWLLVLDNVPDATAAHAMLPSIANGHILITSRATSWPDPSIVIPVRPLDSDLAVVLLTTLSLDTDRLSAAALAEELGGLPLALIQAAAFIRASGVSLDTYLGWYRDRSAELLKERPPADYPHTVATTWQLSIDRLGMPARNLLNLLAFYAPDKIPIHRLLDSRESGVLADTLTRHRAIGELHAYSLITHAGSNTITIHRLVQAVIRNSLFADEVAHEWADTACSLIVAGMPEEPVTAHTIATWSVLHTHVHALLEHLPYERPDILTFRRRVANWSGNIGDAPTARDLLADLLPVQGQVLGAEHPDTLTTRHDLAYWTGIAGDPVRARDMLAALVLVRERVLGAAHPHTLSTRNYLARWTGRAGDAAGARDQAAALLPVRERVLGAEHPSTLTTRHNLARWTGRAGDASRARDLFIELLPIRARVSGSEHPHTLATRYNLAHWTGVAGDATRARDLFAELLPIHEQVLGAEHRDTLRTRHQLASWTGRAGDAEAARDLFTELLAIRKRAFGADHHRTLRTQNNLAHWTAQALKPQSQQAKPESA